MNAPRWSRRQVALLRRLAGQASLEQIAQRLSARGPARSPDAVRKFATKRGIAWRGKRGTFARAPWTEWEDALLRSLAGRASADEIAEALNARFETARSVGTVTRRASTIGISLVRGDGLTLESVRSALGMGLERIRREVTDGRLRAEQRGDGHRGSLWLFLPADVEAWIRANPHAHDWRRIRRRSWRDLARATALKDPYLTISEAAAHLGIDRKTVQQWVREGRIGGVLDVGTPLKPLYRIPLRALDQIERLARRGAA